MGDVFDIPAGWTIQKDDFRGYVFWHENHDGDNGLQGHEYTLQEAIDEIKEIEAERTA